MFLVNEAAGHSGAADFGEGFDVDDFFMEEVAEKKHGNGGENTSANDSAGAFFDEDVERFAKDEKHLWEEEELFAVDLSDEVVNLGVVAVVFGFFCDDENLVFLRELLEHEKLFKMTARGGDEANFVH